MHMEIKFKLKKFIEMGEGWGWEHREPAQTSWVIPSSLGLIKFLSHVQISTDTRYRKGTVFVKTTDY